MKLKLLTILAFIAIFSIYSFGQSVIKDNLSKFNEFTPVRFGTLEFADVDNDNDQDILITGQSDEYVAKLYLNNGSGEFTEVSNTPFEGVYFGSTAFVDIDNDNYQDVIITGLNNSNYNITKLYKNDGNGDFTEILDTPFMGVYSSHVLFNDIDNDNDQDVLIAGNSYGYGRIAKIYLNNGQGIFTELSKNPFEGVEINGIAFIDIENDGDDDVLITGENAKIFGNDGHGNFTEMTNLTFEDCFYGSVVIADIDNDNDKDVLIHGHYPDSYWTPTVNLYTNDGNGNFTKLFANLTGVYTGFVSFCDFDNDNDQDVLITGDASYPGFESITKLYKNDGYGDFTEIENTPFEGVRESCNAFADVDNDGYEDLIISGTTTSNVITKLYYNVNHIVENIPPNLVNENYLSNIKLFPNPTNGIINFKFANNNVRKLSISDITGKTIIEKMTIKRNEMIDLSSFERGIYIIKVQTDEKIFNTKIVKR